MLLPPLSPIFAEPSMLAFFVFGVDGRTKGTAAESRESEKKKTPRVDLPQLICGV
jgi:hypothetical protein